MWIGGSNEDPKIFPEGLVIIMCQFVGFRTSSASVVYLLDKIRIVSLLLIHSSFLCQAGYLQVNSQWVGDRARRNDITD